MQPFYVGEGGVGSEGEGGEGLTRGMEMMHLNRRQFHHDGGWVK
jgi:hypothetical protein